MRRCYVAGVMLVMAFVIFCGADARGEEKKTERHWYMMQIQTGSTTYQCFGSSLLDEKEMTKQLNGTEYVVLDDLVYRDNEGKIKSWQEWDPLMGARVYMNPKYIILFQPLPNEPRIKDAAAPKKNK